MDAFLNWFEEHKIGVIGTLAVHSALLFVFLLSNLRSIPREDERSDMAIEIVDSEEAEEMIEVYSAYLPMSVWQERDGWVCLAGQRPL